MNPVNELLTPRQRLYVYALAFLFSKGLGVALAVFLVLGGAPVWLQAVAAGWAVLSPTEGLAIRHVPGNAG